MTKRFTDLANKAAQKGDWKTAVSMALEGERHGEDSMRELPQYDMPWEAIHHAAEGMLRLKARNERLDGSEFLYYAAHNLPKDEFNPSVDQAVAKLLELDDGNEYSALSDVDHPAIRRFVKNHPLRHPADFFYSYEKKVNPEHFATIHHWLNNSEDPVEMTDHRGKVGTSAKWQHAIPALEAYAKSAQDQIWKDITKKSGGRSRNAGYHFSEDDGWYRSPYEGFSEPHVLLYRGVAGDYGKKLLDAAGVDLTTEDGAKNSVEIPISPMASWTADINVAHRFASTRSIPGQANGYGAVIAKWFPLKHVLHSGWHNAHHLQEHAHPDEFEFVVKHPEGSLRIHPREIVARNRWDETFAPDHEDPEYKQKLREELIQKHQEIKAKADGTFDWLPVAQKLSSSLLFVRHKGAGSSGGIQTHKHPLGPFESSGVSPERYVIETHGDSTEAFRSRFRSAHAKLSEALGSFFEGKPFSAKHVRERFDSITAHCGLTFKLGTLPPEKSVGFTPSERMHYHPSDHPDLGDDPRLDDEIKLGPPTAKSEEPKDPALKKYDTQFEEYLRAAESLAGRRHDPTTLRDARHTSQDMLTQALRSVGLEASADNKSAVESVLKLSDSEGKHEVESPLLYAQTVEAMMPDGKEFAHAIRRGYKTKNVRSSHLYGRHTKGSVLVKDPLGGKLYLIKTGAGGQNPAAGENEDPSSPSQREAAFYRAAGVFGLKSFLPECHLLALDEQPVAVLEFLHEDWETIEDLRESDSAVMNRVFEKYRHSGDLFRWAVMDYVLGQVDRHFANVMTNREKVKLIDEGSAFAGFQFNVDDKAVFVPCYLRYTVPVDVDFHALPHEDRLQRMVYASSELQVELDSWIRSIRADDLEQALLPFGIDPKPSVMRLYQLQTAPDHVDVAVCKAWSGLLPYKES